MTILLIGDSCSGKTSLERELCNHGYNRIISYTSRPIRKNEVQDIDYHFVTADDFINRLDRGFFAESTIYNSWRYGIAQKDCIDDAIAVVEPVGARQLRKNPNLHIISFYIEVEERERVIRMMKRGDSVMESFRRIISDQGSFNGIHREVDYIIQNQDGKLDLAVGQILEILGGRN